MLATFSCGLVGCVVPRHSEPVCHPSCLHVTPDSYFAVKLYGFAATFSCSLQCKFPTFCNEFKHCRGYTEHAIRLDAPIGIM